MVERLLITFVIGVLSMGAYQLLLLYQRRRAGLAVSTAPAPNTTGPVPVRLLYFHSEHCGACIAQAHYLAALEAHHRALVEPIDVEREPALARQFKVMTLPTTILIDSRGRVRHINPGLVNPFKLTRQLEDLRRNNYGLV